MKEIWRDVVGYEWKYQVSNFGNVKSLRRIDDNNHVVIERILKQNINKYAHVTLYKDGKPKVCKIHRLKAQAFIPNPKNKPLVCHRDNNKLNNWLHADWEDNLYRGTYWENNKYWYDCWRKHPMLWRMGKDNPKSKQVAQYTLDWKFIRNWENAQLIKKELWYNPASIQWCCVEKYKTAYWFIWEYC